MTIATTAQPSTTDAPTTSNPVDHDSTVLAAKPGKDPEVVCLYCGESYCRRAGGTYRCEEEDDIQDGLRQMADAPWLTIRMAS